MTRTWFAVRLGLRVSTARASARRATRGVAGTMLVATIGLLTLAGLQHAATARAVRVGNRSPRGVEVGRARRAADLLWVERTDRWAGRPLRRVVIAGGVRSVLPPGLDRLPAMGRPVLSPALARLAIREPLVRVRFPHPAATTIGAVGLDEPDELLAYVRVPASSLDRSAHLVSGFGGAPADRRSAGGLRPLVLAGVMAFVAVPAGLAVYLAGRIGHEHQRRTASALHAVGLPRSARAVVRAAPIAFAATVGCLAGLVLGAVLAAGAAGRSVGGHRADRADLCPTPLTIVAIIGALVVLATVMAAAGARSRDHRSPSRQQTLLSRHVGLASTGIGLFCLFMSRSTVAGTSTRRLALDGALLLLAFGAPAMVAAIARAAGASLRRRRSIGVFLAARRTQRDPWSIGRPAGVLAATVLVVSFSNYVVTRFAGEVARPRHQVFLVGSASTHPPPVPPAGVLVLPVAEESDGNGPRMVLATCPQLATIAGVRRLAGCSRSPVAITTRFSPAARSKVRLDDGSTVGLHDRPLRLMVPGASAFTDAIKVDPHSRLGRSLRTSVTGAIAWSAGPGRERRRFEAAVVANDPMATIDVVDDTGVEAAISYQRNGEWFRTGSWLFLAMVLPGLALSLGGVITERRRQLAALAALGLPPSLLARSTFVEVAGTMLLGALLGSVLGVAVAASYSAIVHDGEIFGTASRVLTTAAMAASLIAAIGCAAATAQVCRAPLDHLDE